VSPTSRLFVFLVKDVEGAEYVSDEQLRKGMKGWAKCTDPGYEGRYFPAEIQEVLGAAATSTTIKKSRSLEAKPTNQAKPSKLKEDKPSKQKEDNPSKQKENEEKKLKKMAKEKKKQQMEESSKLT
jgi:hypothetical protein